MPLTVEDALGLEVVERALPEYLTGDVTQPIRWAHSSEIAEIGPLMRGGEMLFTTGLGLNGASDAGIRDYVGSLTANGVSALVLELGRTFDSAPPTMVRSAAEADLALIVLHSVVPFVDITEAINATILEGRLDQLHRADLASQLLGREILAGSGLTALMQCLTSVIGVPACLVSGEDTILCRSDDWDERPTTGQTEYEIQLNGRTWGRLLLACGRSDEVDAIGERSALAFGLELVRQNVGLHDPRQAARRFLADLATGQEMSEYELLHRSQEAELPTSAGRLVAGVLRPPWDSSDGGYIEFAAARLSLRCLAATVRDRIAFVIEADPGSHRAMLDDLLLEIERARATTVRTETRITYADRIDSVRDLAGVLPSLIEASQIVDHLNIGRKTVHFADVTFYRVLENLSDSHLADEIISTQLGPLLGNEKLIETLDAMVASGGNKTRTAAMIGVRRQTLYNRLYRIEQLLGYEPSAANYLNLALALAAHRLSDAGRLPAN